MKNKKRLIAILSSVAIIILSIAFGRTASLNKQEAENEVMQTTFSSIFNRNLTGKKIILQEGDSSNTIQRIKIEGTIDSNMTNKEVTYSVIDQINIAASDLNVKAILLVVNTPGGGVYESSEIYNALLNSGKDVYVSMENYATSGGYYISMAAKKIYANQETITGSIGVVMSNLSAQQFLNDKGIKNQIIRSGEQKAVGGLTEDMSESAIDIYKEINLETYERFIDIIVKGRNMDREKVLSLADGRIYSAQQALKHGLIDKIAGQNELIGEIKDDKGLINPQIIEYRQADTNAGFLNNLISSLSKSIVKEIQAASTSTSVQRNFLG